METALQTKIIKWLRSQGAYVIKTRPGMGTPNGTPDVVALYGAKHAELEVKSGPKATFQPGQQATLSFLRRDNQFVYRVDPVSWPEIKAELERDFF